MTKAKCICGCTQGYLQRGKRAGGTFAQGATHINDLTSEQYPDRRFG